MDEHKKFLADRILSEERPITYRVLSRAIDVHVNTAKEMLYDFHKYQNSMHTNSVYATYLVYGTKSSSNSQADGDVEMTSSMPEHEPLSDEVQVHTVTLVNEDDLKDILNEYQQVSSIHMYSLGPHPQRDLTSLFTGAKSISEFKVEDDPSTASQKYGTIYNPYVRRRDLKGRRVVPVTSTSKLVNQEPSSATSSQSAKIKQEANEDVKMETPQSSSSTKKNTPQLKREGLGGGIMQSFAKAAAKPQRKAAAKEEDILMALSDDGEADDEDLTSSKPPSTDIEANRNSRRQREEELRRMMEDEDDEAEAESEEQSDQHEDEDMEEVPEPEPEPEPEEDPTSNARSREVEKDASASEPADVVSSVSNGRRRGRRKVTKKKRILDDQGYMVTIQESGWESFSEDETPPPAKRPAPTATPASSGTKTKRPATGKSSQGGQGSIMSFFSKK